MFFIDINKETRIKHPGIRFSSSCTLPSAQHTTFAFTLTLPTPHLNSVVVITYYHNLTTMHKFEREDIALKLFHLNTTFQMIVGFSKNIYIIVFSKHFPVLKCLDNYCSGILLLVSIQNHCLLLLFRSLYEIVDI